jgi:DNA (cytosine-5)-methyltransferase 1
MGRAPRDGEYMHIVGNFIGAEQGRRVMGIPWATRNELREAIPPAYTKYIGALLMARLPAVSSEVTP